MSSVAQVQIERIGRAGSGPVVAVLGGVHGDEPEGIVAAGLLTRALAESDLHGEVRIVRVANAAAFAENARAARGDDNLARVFPGSPQGSEAERIASRITEDVIADADLLVDLHSAGTHYRMPLFAGYDAASATAPEAHRAAVAFGAPLVWRHDGIAAGRSLSAADAVGVPSIYVETGGGGRLRRSDLDAYVNGVQRVLAAWGVLPAAPAAASEPRFIDDGDGDIDDMYAAEQNGFCVAGVRAGDVVEPGATIADVVDEYGRSLQRIVADREAIVMMIRATARISAGDGIAMLAAVGR